MIQPLLDLTATLLLDQHCKVPLWTQKVDFDSLPLLRADRWIEEACLMLREPALGLMALAHVDRGAGEVIEFAAESAETLMDALMVFSRHIRTVNQAASVHLHVQESSAILVIGSPLSLSHAMRDYLVGAMARAIVRWLEPSGELELWFAGPRPSYAAAYRRALGEVSVGFYAPCDAVVIPSSRLGAAMRSADPKLHDFLLKAARRLALT